MKRPTQKQMDVLREIDRGLISFTCMTNAQYARYIRPDRSEVNKITMRSLIAAGLVQAETVTDRMYARDRVLTLTQAGRDLIR